jgi:hypothetical protein
MMLASARQVKIAVNGNRGSKIAQSHEARTIMHVLFTE